MRNGRKKASSHKNSKAARLEKQRQKKTEEEAALSEKTGENPPPNITLNTRTRNGSQPSVGAIATAKKLEREKLEMLEGFGEKILRDVNREQLPTKREDQLAYIRSMKPKLSTPSVDCT